MKVSQIVSRARSIAALPETEAISHDDELASVNASWRDLYARILESNDDFILTTRVIALTPAMLVGTNEYRVPLPADFYRLRTVDYRDGTGEWKSMDKFPPTARNDLPSSPYYRFDGTSLWILGARFSDVRLRYYPPSEELTHPETDLEYATGATPLTFPTITDPVHVAYHNTGCYIEGGTDITAGSIDDNTDATPVVLFGSLGATNLVYYKGYLYWLEAADIWRAPTDLVTAPLVPVNVTGTGTVTSFSVFHDHLYYCDAGSMFIDDLGGGAPVLLLAAAGTWLTLAGGTVFYVDAGNLRVIPTAALVLAGVTACVSDGMDLYVLTATGELRRLTMAGAAIVTNTLVREDVAAIGPWADHRIPLLTGESQKMLAISDYPDSDITYPAEVVYEIIEYQAAIDFCSKTGRDFSALKARLGMPADESPTGKATGLWARMDKAVKRDDYRPQRIGNSRRIWGNW